MFFCASYIVQPVMGVPPEMTGTSPETALYVMTWPFLPESAEVNVIALLTR